MSPFRPFRLGIAAVVLVVLGLAGSTYLFFWYTQKIEPAQLEVAGMARAIQLYLDSQDAKFPPCFEALVKSGVIRRNARGFWSPVNRPLTYPELAGEIPGFPFDPTNLLVRWNFQPEGSGVEASLPLVTHIHLSRTDKAVVFWNERLRKFMKRWPERGIGLPLPFTPNLTTRTESRPGSRRDADASSRPVR